MIGDVILPNTQPEDWKSLRQSILDRVVSTFGEPQIYQERPKPEIREVETYEKYGLKHIKVQYPVTESEWNEGVLVLPADTSKPIPAVLAVHGTHDLAKEVCLNKEEFGIEAYAVELAERGYVAFAVDQFGFGAMNKGRDRKTVTDEFYKKYPDSTLDGRRVVEQMCALDVLESLDYVDNSKLGVMGHSLGGRAAGNLGCLDERIAATVVSSGISPNITNVYRRLTWSEPQNPIIAKKIMDGFGKVPWDYHEFIALCAPRPFLAIEPYNDDYNPDMMTTYACIDKAGKVYNLLGKGEHLSLVAHGEGHGTSPMYREMAYAWFERFLKNS